MFYIYIDIITHKFYPRGLIKIYYINWYNVIAPYVIYVAIIYSHIVLFHV